MDRRGTLPIAEPLLLPAGNYQLRISAPQCAPFTADVRITSGGTASPQIRLLCTPAR